MVGKLAKVLIVTIKSVEIIGCLAKIQIPVAIKVIMKITTSNLVISRLPFRSPKIKIPEHNIAVASVV